MPEPANPNPSPPQGATPPEGSEKNPEQLEGEFFDRMMGRMDKWFDDKIKTYRTTGTSRMGKTTLPEIVANIVFGPKKDD